MLSNLPKLNHACSLTIGSFDGVHLGHQMLLQRMQETSLPAVVITFANHPSEVFAQAVPQLICTLQHRIQLLKRYGATHVACIPFTRDLASLSAEEFLCIVSERVPFKALVLGEGASFGRNREGTEKRVNELAASLEFEALYLKKNTLGGVPISSGRIRTLIAEGNLQEAAQCLGRPYSILLPAHESNHLPLFGLSLPPTGNYPVHYLWKDTESKGTVYVDRGRGEIVLDAAQPKHCVEVLFQ